MSNNNEIRSEPFNIKDFISKALSYKYFYITSLILLVTLAWLYNKFTPTVYEVNSIIGPVEENRSSFLESNDRFSGVGALYQTRNLENDINSLNSFSLVSETIENLGLEIGYYRESSSSIFNQIQQVYRNSSYLVSMDKSHIQSINARYYIDILSDTTYRLTVSEDNVSFYNYLDNNIISSGQMLQIDTVCRFNQTVTTPYFKFSIARNSYSNTGPTTDDKNSFFRLHHVDEITSQYLNRLTIEPVSLRSTLINVYFRGTNRELTVDFLNSYLQTYLDKNLSKKNTIALNTINFIDNQISEISDSLYLSESKLRDYRSTHQVTDLSFQGQQALSQMQQIEEEKSTIKVQERYYNYILDYFNNNQDIAGLAPPSASNIQDPIMNSLVLELLDLNAQRSTILSSNTQKNLFLDQIENKINLQKKTIIENVKNNLNALSLSMNELDYREKQLSTQISNLPRTELNMVSMQRAFNLTDAIYTFMAQKRSEAAIAMASNYPDYEILEPARDVTKRIIAPKAMLNYMGSIFLALLLPTLFIILRDFFNENITNIKEVEQITGRQILTSIFKNSYKYDTVVHNAPGSSIAESFRNLRSILFFKAKKQPLKVILITSCQPQDGKSFVALNLASSIASVGHRTILVDCDLRKPTLHKKLDLENYGGLSEYLTNHSESKDIIVNTFIDNLDFIPAGPVLPNSSELIESGALDELINYLESKYEYLIIDTTPSGMVADATLLLKYASLTLLVCRKDHTRKDTLADVLNLFTINGVENFEVVYNDIEAKESRYGQYHGYYDQKKKHKKRADSKRNL